jgi:alpha-beta hydrolase superfamily lysophospholipase
VPLADTKTGIDRLAGTDVTARIFPHARHEVFNETNRDEVLHEVARFASRVAAPR